MKKSYLFISLGHDCFVKSYIINHLKKDQPTYIFDWLRFYYVRDLIKIFENDFMNKEDFVSDIESPIGEATPSKNIVHKFNKKFNYTVKHDFTILDNFEEVKEKYNRRIERFKEDAKNTNIAFIRCMFNDDNIDDYLELYKQLQVYTKKCILILIHNSNNLNIPHDNIYLIKHNSHTLWSENDMNIENVKSIILQIQKIVNIHRCK